MSKPALLRAQPIGSLLRSETLKAARQKLDAGSLTMRDYKRIEDGAVREAIALQEDVGLQVLTDGEQRRNSYLSCVYDALDGWERTSDAIKTEWYSEDGESVEMQSHLVAESRLLRRRSAFVEEVTYARAITRQAIKVTLPCPTGVLYNWHPEASKEAYADPYQLFADVAAFLRQEVEDLADLGCEYFQIDAPEFTALVDERRLKEFVEIGIDPDRLVADGVDWINQIFDGLDGVRVGLHMCRGNWNGKYMAEGGYDAISKQVFQRAYVVDDFFLEFDDERSGSFEPLGDVPRDKVVMLGLVSTKRGKLEDLREMLRRVDEAAEFFPREQLGVCTQCGFASGWGGNPVTPAEQRAKLQLVVEIARAAWPD